MPTSRRTLLKLLVGSAAIAAYPFRVLADFVRPQAAFDAKNVTSAFAELGEMPEDSNLIQLETPNIAENGAVVPVAITSLISGTSRIFVIVEMNPNPLSAGFAIPEGTEAYVATRVKMAQTCMVYGVVEANGKLFKTGKETKVTLGGCGG